MKIEIHTLYWDNTECFLDPHKKVMEHFGIDVIYHHNNGRQHGEFVDTLTRESSADIIGFIDIDCVPIYRGIYDFCINYTETMESMIGTAQCANHIFPSIHICASHVFHFLWRDTWVKVGKPSLLPNHRGDVGEELSWVFDENQIHYKAIYPTCFEEIPEEGVWKLGNYGYFGIGTVFGNSIYHLFQSRFRTYEEKFRIRCNEIIEGTFTTNNFMSSI